ncbi:MAG: Hpt domain-containing protein [Chitinispirillales bacterium]|jgi:HPt (histidine-containing phosphotransfer) domain-containing protein|nr:Hpt domain-containing protein [Chitinispirillales bacterium]
MGIEVPARFGGKKELFEKLVKMFVRDLPPEWTDYTAAIADMENTKALVHKIKGTSGNLDLKGVYEAAVAFEGSLRNNAPDKELYIKFTEACDAVRKTMEGA